MKIYLDSAIIIYLIEQVDPYHSKILPLFSEDVIFVSSHLSLLECSIKPTKENNIQLIEDFNTFFYKILNNFEPILLPIIETAIELRSRYNVKTPDAIHLATAIQTKSALFLTNDKRLNRFDMISIKTLDDDLWK